MPKKTLTDEFQTGFFHEFETANKSETQDEPVEVVAEPKKPIIKKPIYENNEYFKRFYGITYAQALEQVTKELRDAGLNENEFLKDRNWTDVLRVMKSKRNLKYAKELGKEKLKELFEKIEL